MANLIRKHDIFNPNLLRDFFDDDFLSDTFFHRRITPPVNISEGDAEYIIEVSTPGIEKENIKIKRQKNLITISYDQEESSETRERNYHRREFQRRSFTRSLNLPEGVDLDKITSEYKDGILKVTIPKMEREVKRDETVDIEIH